MFRGFLFDFDGTLVDTERESGEAMARALERRHQPSIAVEQSDRDFVIGRSWVAIYERLQQRYPQLTWPRAELIAHTADEREDVLKERGITVLPGAREVLAWTRNKPRALVTGSSRVEVLQILPTFGDDGTFDVIFAAEDVKTSKPSPEGYLSAKAALGAGDYLVIEDSQAGIEAGRAAGCVVLAVRAGNFGGWDQSRAHCVIDSLADLTPQLVDRLARDYGSGGP